MSYNYNKNLVSASQSLRKNMTPEEKEKIEQVKQTPKYQERCDKLADYIATHRDYLDQ